MVLLDPQALLKSDESRPRLCWRCTVSSLYVTLTRCVASAMTGLFLAARGERLIVKREGDDVTAYDEVERT